MVPVYRYIGTSFFSDIKLWDIATPGSLDSLSFGALLAYYSRYPNSLYNKLIQHRKTILFAAMILYGFNEYSSFLPWKFGYLNCTFESIIFTVVIYDASIGIGGFAGKFLNSSMLRYLGKIAYALYVLHNFAQIPTAAILKYFGVLKPIQFLSLALKTFLTIVTASISWHFFEDPINKLKKHFPYNKNQEQTTGDSAQLSPAFRTGSND